MRVFISGMGMISSLGNSPEMAFKALAENQTAVRKVPEWASLVGLQSFVAAPAQPYDSLKISRNVRRSMSAMSEMALLATTQALGQADLSPERDIHSERTLLCLGSTAGSPSTLLTYYKKYIEKGGPEGQLSTSFFKVMNHSVAANVAHGLNYKGALLSVASACSTSTQALTLGWELIRTGQYDMAIVGGSDELHSTSTAVFDVVHAASRGYNDRPLETPRPFDRDRDGLVVSEGAGVVILESEAHLKKRGGRPIAEFLGGAYLCDGSHMTQSSSEMMVNVMGRVLKLAGKSAHDIQYVNAHATGTVHGDIEEAKAISQLFGDKVPVSSLKAHFGHSLAACGAIEVILGVMMMKKSTLISTRNLLNVAPECAGINHLQENTPKNFRCFLSNNFAFGGMNASVVVSDIV